ncbi:hypothetical protein HaLaN_09922 [Haematococcus lacustris]|uniref:Uncharacterized protein n=1 Tax=Haematococcus lacustris TaxID=44745 RepID=A0A699YUW2_HAELA|nr:hypothetical protein HaLaN_09922 [Haematococcus lacustris]
MVGGLGGSLGPGAELAAGCKELAGVEGLEGLSGPELQELLARARARVRRRVWWPDQGQAGGQGVGHGGAQPCQPHATKLMMTWVHLMWPLPLHLSPPAAPPTSVASSFRKRQEAQGFRERQEKSAASEQGRGPLGGDA